MGTRQTNGRANYAGAPYCRCFLVLHSTKAEGYAECHIRQTNLAELKKGAPTGHGTMTLAELVLDRGLDIGETTEDQTWQSPNAAPQRD